MTSLLMMQGNPSASTLQNQLTRSLERILEEAHLSGELRLSGRKLKDFPKTAGKYHLNDTVIADLSRNRFCELPEDVTTFPFLETLLVFHNTIRSIPESVRGLHSLSYLDLRSNQLTTLPKEICFLPLQVLLVANNRLTALPDEMGRMDRLTELDAACNQITHLPARIIDMKSLRALSLRNNQLVYLPKELTFLHLVSLDISCNRIATLPIELKQMQSLVNLELDNNPLTSPPASLCIRGLVHVFKYLETISQREDRSRLSGGGSNGMSTIDGHATLRRCAAAKHNTNSLDGYRAKRHNEVTYSVSDATSDKRWSNDAASKLSPYKSTTGTLTPSSGLSSPANSLGSRSLEDELKQAGTYLTQELKQQPQTLSADNSPEDHEKNGMDEKNSFDNIQTYREYKEARRQLRNQDSSSVYRTKEQPTPPDQSPESMQPKSKQSSPISPQHHIINTSNANHNNEYDGTTTAITPNNKNYNNYITDDQSNNRVATITAASANGGCKPVQKVTPSRNVNSMNGNHYGNRDQEYAYIKPISPSKGVGGGGGNNLGYNNVPGAGSPSSPASLNKTAKVPKDKRTVCWKNGDNPPEKLSFTMRREFDRQKEETELIQQLRMIIETRLKMTLPDDIAPALTDGVVLCHLANHVRPRSVASIHVPSPAVPKLTMARCRRNVDNFLEACRKIGVDEELICSCADIVPSPPTSAIGSPGHTNGAESIDYHNQSSTSNTVDDPSSSPSTPNSSGSSHVLNWPAIYNTVHALVYLTNGGASTTTATNTKLTPQPTDDNSNVRRSIVEFDDDDEDEDDDGQFNNDGHAAVVLAHRGAPNSLDLTLNGGHRKRTRLSNIKRNFNQKIKSNLVINGIIVEECEYDSDVGKFNCGGGVDGAESSTISEASTASTTSADLKTFTAINDLNASPIKERNFNNNNEQLNINTEMNEKKIVSKRIEFFESHHSGGNDSTMSDNDEIPSQLENLMCCAADVLEGKAVVQVAITVCELLRFYSHNTSAHNSPANGSHHHTVLSPSKSGNSSTVTLTTSSQQQNNGITKSPGRTTASITQLPTPVKTAASPASAFA